VSDAQQLTVDEDIGDRLDAWLSPRLAELSRSRIQSLIKDGAITVNGKPAKTRQPVRRDDVIDICVPETVAVDLIPEDIPLDVLFEDEHLIAINKPPGLVVHPAVGNETGTLVHALLHHCSDLQGIGGEARPGIVHRLDKHTSGIIVVAKTEPALIELQRQFKERLTTKTYRAICQGIPRLATGTIDQPIGRHPQHRKKMAIHERGRNAVSHWTVEERFEDAPAALLKVRIETGRTHQIRVHLQSIGHPVVGDKVYGGKGKVEAARQMLHAAELQIAHPNHGETMTLKTPLPDDMNALLNSLRD